MIAAQCADAFGSPGTGTGTLFDDGIDLNPHCIERARARDVPGATFERGLVEAFPEREGHYDAVVCFEVVEHVRDPDQLLTLLAACCKPGGSLFISTPLGACTGGDLPRWWVVEPAGHVRAYTPKTFAELLSRHGEIDQVVASEASQGALMVARVTVPGGASIAVEEPEVAHADA